MPESKPFRYAQFCPLARAAEILGERWTLLILRELSLGPQRFSDLRKRLGSVSSSVLTDRLGRLESRGLLRQRALAPPAASTVYEMTEAGEATKPALRELMRWGARFLLPPVPGDQFETVWLVTGLQAFARPGPTPGFRVEIRVADADGDDVVIRFAGGAKGTRVVGDGPVDATVRGEPMAILAVLGGIVAPSEATRTGALRFEGDEAALEALPELFDLAESPLADVARGAAGG